MKICLKCNENKNESEYYKKLKSLTSWCKQCVNEDRQKPENKERRRKWENGWNAKNRELCNKKRVKWQHNNPEKVLLIAARRRAKKNNLEFNIDIDDILIPTVCPVLKIPIFPSEEATDNSPSLDRVDVNKGYVKGNVMVISNRANKLKRDATLQELWLMASRYEQLISGKPATTEP